MSWLYQPLIAAAADLLSGGEPPVGSAGYIKVWTGSQWAIKPVKEWNGSQWTIKPIKFYNGASWITTSGL